MHHVALYKISLLPCAEELWDVSPGGENFTKLDLRYAYQRVPLGVDSLQFVSMNTHMGGHSQCMWLLFEALSQVIFQRRRDCLLMAIQISNVLHLTCRCVDDKELLA